jgi:hypothetical protein
LDSQYLWLAVCEIIKWHNKGTDQCIDTLNRLWRKHTEVVAPNGESLLHVPTLTEAMFTVRAELWPLDRLLTLKRSHQRNRPLFFPPIVVLNWFDRFFLLDGTTRINLWSEVGNMGPHAVLIVAERNGEA